MPVSDNVYGKASGAKKDSIVKSPDSGRLRKKLHMQGAQILRNEAYS
ncbi:MAG: hypothetical protein HZA12_07250 [Nitrospirae bacterium]|nr:hypothetical protein [Nitrospirota bacterium]